MHDAVTGERVGTASVAIITDTFVSGAALMASALGAPGYAFAVIGHPISSATSDELAAKAEATLDAAAHLLMSAPVATH